MAVAATPNRRRPKGEGRLAAGVLMVLDITLFAGITATITSFLLVPPADSQPGPKSPAEDQIYQLMRLRDAEVLTQDEWLAGIGRIAPSPGSLRPEPEPRERP